MLKLHRRTIQAVLIQAVVALAAVLAGRAACDNEDFLTRSRQTLWANRAAWMDIQDIAAELRQQGKIDDAQWGRFEELDAKYRAAHNSAVLALDEYDRVRDDDSKVVIVTLLADAGAIVRQARELIQAWLKEGA